MTSEINWRRKWKQSLDCIPWKAVTNDDHQFLYKCLITNNSYEFLISNGVYTYIEVLDQIKIQQRSQKLNPNVEIPVHKLLDHLSTHIDNLQATNVKLSEGKCIVTLETRLAGLPFVWKFAATLCEPSVVCEHMTHPLMGMVSELMRRQSELVHLLQRKDKEIDDYKAQGAKVTRKHLMTVPFDETAFKDSMNTSQGFERVASHLNEDTFNEEGRQFYTDLMMKRAWLMHRNDEDEDGPPSPKKAAVSGESWNARVPASVVSPSVSPSKSPTKGSSPQKTAISDSPAKDTETLRRQALERKLAEEEDKKEQKKKKKKLKI